MERGFLGVVRLGWWLSRKFYHHNFLSNYKLGRRVVGDIIDNQKPIFGWFCIPWRCAVVYFISMEQFVFDLWKASLLVLWYVCKYGLLHSQILKWCAGLSHLKRYFFGNMILVPVWCLLKDYPDKYGLQSSDGRYILVRGAMPLRCKFWCVVPLSTYFPWRFSRIVYKYIDSSG